MKRAGLVFAAIGLAAATGCMSVDAERAARGLRNLRGAWRVVSYEAAGAEGDEEGSSIAFTEESVHERWQGSQREAKTRYQVRPGARAGTYLIELGEGLAPWLATFTPKGDLLLVLPAEVGSGWARTNARVQLLRMDD
ncbi:MAG: hypothetical protein ACYTFT_03550 [Planctomycetota bacterium]|jgi:hypothetical protein